MSSHVNLRRLIAWPICASALVLLSVACDKEDKITVENFIQEPANQPPVIVNQGPDLPPGGFQAIDMNSPDLYVLVGDPNGLDDISLVTVDVESVELVRFRLRPNVRTDGCVDFGFAPAETLSTELILSTPHSFPGLEFEPLTKVQGGLYRAQAFGSFGYGFPDLLGEASNVVSMGGGCGSFSDGILFPWIVMPPAAPSDTAAVVSLAEVRYIGVSVTVYDKVGASATTTFPDWHVTFLSREEEETLP